MKAFLHALLGKLSFPFRRRRLDREMAEEMRLHREVLVEQFLAAGMTSEEARRAAALKFGSTDRVQEECHDERSAIWLEHWGKDVRFAARSLFHAPAFSASVILTLVLGIGVTSLIFTDADRVLFRSPPYPEPDRVVWITAEDNQGQFLVWRTGIHLRAYQEQLDHVFSEFAAATWDLSNVVIQDEPDAIVIRRVSEDFFHFLGIAPNLGRAFRADEHVAGNDSVIVISDRFWRQRFDRDPDILGQQIEINQQPCTVVGVLAANQRMPTVFAADIYQPLVLALDPSNPFVPNFYIFGRLRSGVPVSAARDAMDKVELDPGMPDWAVAYFGEQKPVLKNPKDLDRPDISWMLLTSGLALLAIAALNTTNLTLVRTIGRGRELSIRLAVGGTRAQIARLLAAESGLLCLVAFIIVAVGGYWLWPVYRQLYWLGIDETSLAFAHGWGWRSIGFVGLLTGFALCAMAVVPAARMLKVDIPKGLQGGGAALGESRRIGKVRNSLVVLQAALAVVLLVGTGLMVRTFEQIRRVDLGFESTGRVEVRCLFPRHYDPKPEERLQLFQRFADRIRTLPGVTAVSFGSKTLLRGGFVGTGQLLMPDGSYIPVAGEFVPHDYYETAGMTLLKGRWLSGKRGVVEVVLNDSMAKARFGDEDPIGQHIKLQVSGDYQFEVVGVIRDVRESVRSKAGLTLYTPAWTYPPNITTLLIRTEQAPASTFGDVVRRAMYEINPYVIVATVQPMRDVIDASMVTERTVLRFLQTLAGIALLLTVGGLFSVIAYTVENRKSEFGLRMALGATTANVMRLVLKRGLVVCAIGIVLGMAGAVILARFLKSFLFETTTYDPLVYLAVAALLLTAGLLACWIPARRSTRVDLTRLLRSE